MNYSARIRAKELLEERIAEESERDNKDIINDDSYIPASETLNTSGHASFDSRIAEIQGRIFENAEETRNSHKSMETREY